MSEHAKLCPTCDQAKPIEAFSRCAARSDGLSYDCRQCRSARRLSPVVRQRRDLAAQGLRQCVRCEETKPATLEHFRGRSDAPDGIESLCRACRSVTGEATKRRRQLVAEGLRQCRVCDQVKPLSEFRRQGSSRRATECSPCHVAAETARAQTPEVHAYRLVYSAEYRADPTNAAKIKARSEVNKAIRRGDIVRQPCCECGAKRADAHHHNGYDTAHWFDVEWLCRRCHMRGHAEERLAS